MKYLKFEIGNYKSKKDLVDKLVEYEVRIGVLDKSVLQKSYEDKLKALGMPVEE